MRGVTGMIALEETISGMVIVLTEGHQAQCIAGVDLVLIMVALVSPHMTNTMVHLMIGTGVPSMEVTAGRFVVADRKFHFTI